MRPTSPAGGSTELPHAATPGPRLRPDRRQARSQPRSLSRDGDWSRLFSSAFKNSRNAMVLLDGARRHVDFNGAYLTLTGYRPSQLRGRPIYEFVVDGPIMTEAELNEGLARGDFTAEGEFVRADGTIVRHTVTCEPHRPSDRQNGFHVCSRFRHSSPEWGEIR